MTTPNIETLATGFGLLEGPVWDPQSGLYFADADFGGVYRLAPDGRTSLVIPHRRGIGGMVFHEDGGLVVSGRNIAYKDLADQPTVIVFENDPAHGIVGFNDITTDAAGRIYAGSLGFYPTKKGDPPRPGALHIIDLDGSNRRLAEGVQLANGLAFSPDGRLLYHADSGDHSIYVHTVASDGSVSDRRLFASMPGALPDGIASAEDGSVWVALAHAGQVVVLNPDASVRARLSFPIAMVTSLCFGGDDRRTVYVVSGPEGSGNPRAGTVFSMRAEVAGLPIARSKVALKPA